METISFYFHEGKHDIFLLGNLKIRDVKNLRIENELLNEIFKTFGQKFFSRNL